jgi:hypothetical protein
MAATVDTTAILLEELAKLGEPLPIEIAAHGFSRIADDVARVLDERGQQRYSAAQWRSALKEVFRKLTDDKGDLRKRSPNLAHRKDDLNTLTSKYEPDPEDVRITARQFDNGIDAVDMDSVRIHARAEQILREGREDDYLAAAMQAELELEPPQTETTRGYSAAESAELHVETIKILLARNVHEGFCSADEYADEYADAIVEAEKVLAINLREGAA